MSLFLPGAGPSKAAENLVLLIMSSTRLGVELHSAAKPWGDVRPD